MLDQKSDDLFSRYPILHRHVHPNTVTNYLFISFAGVHLTKFNSFLTHFNKNAYKNFFFIALACAPAPTARPLATPMRAKHECTYSQFAVCKFWSDLNKE